jgi:preprotein translocase SecE subunit
MIERISKYIKESLAEIKKVNWLSKNEVIILSIRVIIFSLIVALILSIFDAIILTIY